MVSQFVQELSFKVQLYATLESFNLIAIDRETDWVDMKITLPNSMGLPENCEIEFNECQLE